MVERLLKIRQKTSVLYNPVCYCQQLGHILQISFVSYTIHYWKRLSCCYYDFHVTMTFTPPNPCHHLSSPQNWFLSEHFGAFLNHHQYHHHHSVYYFFYSLNFKLHLFFSWLSIKKIGLICLTNMYWFGINSLYEHW